MGLPLKKRLWAWWHGYELTPREVKKVANDTEKPKEAPERPVGAGEPTRWTSARLEAIRILWGSNCAYAIDTISLKVLFAGMRITPSVTAYDLSAFPGPYPEALAAKFEEEVARATSNASLADISRKEDKLPLIECAPGVNLTVGERFMLFGVFALTQEVNKAGTLKPMSQKIRHGGEVSLVEVASLTNEPEVAQEWIGLSGAKLLDADETVKEVQHGGFKVTSLRTVSETWLKTQKSGLEASMLSMESKLADLKDDKKAAVMVFIAEELQRFQAFERALKAEEIEVIQIRGKRVAEG